jgi:hypothetical protein
MCHICFKLTYWFQRRRLLSIFSKSFLLKKLTQLFTHLFFLLNIQKEHTESIIYMSLHRIVYLYFKDKKKCENCEKMNVLFFFNVKCFLKSVRGYPYWKPHNFFLLKIFPVFFPIGSYFKTMSADGDHSCHICFKLTYWFQRRRLLSIFSKSFL